MRNKAVTEDNRQQKLINKEIAEAKAKLPASSKATSKSNLDTSSKAPTPLPPKGEVPSINAGEELIAEA